VHDGKSHSVDSKEIAFIAAGRKAVIAAVRAASPVVLEPMVDVEVVAPQAAVGDLTGDLAGKRGQVTGTEPRGYGTMAVHGQVPLAELDDYQSRLKSLTGGQGAYTIAFSHYAQVPVSTQQALSAHHASTRRDED
jgi:elongation factor G